MDGYVITHKPTKTYIFNDMIIGLILEDLYNSEGVFLFRYKETADNILKNLINSSKDGMLGIEDGPYLISEFEVIKI